MCAGFPAGTGDAHHLVNRSGADVLILEVGNRLAQDAVTYPDDDLLLLGAEDGSVRVLHKDGKPY